LNKNFVQRRGVNTRLDGFIAKTTGRVLIEGGDSLKDRAGFRKILIKCLAQLVLSFSTTIVAFLIPYVFVYWRTDLDFIEVLEETDPVMRQTR